MIQTIFLLAFVLRFYALITPAIWYDEAFSLKVATMPFFELVTFRDFMPPLWEIVLHPFMLLSPTVEMMRTVALIFSMLTMYVVLLITRELKFSQAHTALTLFTLAVLPGMLWMGTDGRAYAFFTFLSTCAIYFSLRKNRTALFITSALMVFTHLIACFMIAVVYGYWILRERNRRLLLDAALLALLWMPLAWHYSQTPGYGITNHTANTFIFQWVMSFWIGSPQLIWIIAFPLTVICLVLAWQNDIAHYFYGPLALMALLSLVSLSVVHYRTLMPALVPFALLIGYLAEKRQAFAFAWICLLLFGAISYDYNAKGSLQREAAALIAAKPAPVVYQTLTLALPFEYYLDDVDDCILETIPNGALSFHRFDIGSCTPSELTPPYWLVTALEPSIPPEAVAQIAPLWEDATLEMEFKYPQIHPVNIYWVEK